jgi:hypothetical protein
MLAHLWLAIKKKNIKRWLYFSTHIFCSAARLIVVIFLFVDTTDHDQGGKYFYSSFVVCSIFLILRSNLLACISYILVSTINWWLLNSLWALGEARIAAIVALSEVCRERYWEMCS